MQNFNYSNLRMEIYKVKHEKCFPRLHYKIKKKIMATEKAPHEQARFWYFFQIQIGTRTEDRTEQSTNPQLNNKQKTDQALMGAAPSNVSTCSHLVNNTFK